MPDCTLSGARTKKAMETAVHVDRGRSTITWKTLRASKSFCCTKTLARGRSPGPLRVGEGKTMARPRLGESERRRRTIGVRVTAAEATELREQVREIDGELAYEKMRRAMEKGRPREGHPREGKAKQGPPWAGTRGSGAGLWPQPLGLSPFNSYICAPRATRPTKGLSSKQSRHDSLQGRPFLRQVGPHNWKKTTQAVFGGRSQR